MRQKLQKRQQNSFSTFLRCETVHSKGHFYLVLIELVSINIIHGD